MTWPAVPRKNAKDPAKSARTHSNGFATRVSMASGFSHDRAIVN